jgi:protein-disulfide isomerase
MSRKSQRNRPSPASPPATPDGKAAGRYNWRSIAFGLGIAALAIMAVSYLFSDKSAQPSGSDPGARSAALSSEHAPTVGDPAARVHIVEFLDPACETCAMFYPLVKQVMARNPGRIRLSVRHLALHEGSDYAVRVLEASRKQDRYWQTLEALLATQSQWAVNHTVRPELLLPAIAMVGLDAERLRSDMDSAETVERVRRDRADAMTLKVTATPEYFVNGRQMQSFGEQQLLSLIDAELQRAYQP